METLNNNVTNTISLRKVNPYAIKTAVANWASAQDSFTMESQAVNGNEPFSATSSGTYVTGGAANTGAAGTGGIVTSAVNYWAYPYYPYTWVSYTSPGTDTTNKVLVAKAENGFVLNYNGKTFIARSEAEVSKIMVKLLK